MGNNSIQIGGVQFNKNSVVSHEVIERDGETLNCVFLKDGTKAVFPNQDPANNASANQYYGTKQEDFLGSANIFGDNRFYSTTKTVTDFDHNVSDFYHIQGLEITGTESNAGQGTYNLKGCKDSTVDVSNSLRADTVNIEDDNKKGKKNKFTSEGNTVKLGVDDSANIEKPANERTNGDRFDHYEDRGIFSERD